MLNFLAMHNQRPWGPLGISFVILAAMLVGVCIYAGRKWIKNEKLFNIVVFIFGLIFVAMEVTHEVSRFKEFGSYDWSSFPFQMCSVTMYLALIIPFIKKGKIKSYFVMFLATFTFLSGILPLIFAQGNLFRWNTIGGVIFSFVWHILLLMLGGVAMGYLDVGKSLREEKSKLFAAFFIFFLITCVAQILNVSIHYLAGGFEVAPGVIKEAGYMPGYELDPDSVSLFYISPYFKSNIGVVFDEIWLKAGWAVCWMVYVLAFIAGALIVYLVNYGVRHLKSLLVAKKEAIVA